MQTGTTRLECSDVLVAIGMQPNVELLAGSSIAVAGGVRVDEYCRTSAPDVFAAGDVAAAGGVRVEHYDNAIKQGGAAAANMLGLDQPYHDPHWFWSDQYHHQLQSIGVAESWDDLVIRGSLADRSFAAFYLLDGRLQAVVALDRPRDVLRSRKLVASRAAVDRERLADESIELRKVAVPV